MSVLDFLVLTLAASGLVHVWFRGSLFAPGRAYVQARSDPPFEDPPASDADPLGYDIGQIPYSSGEPGYMPGPVPQTTTKDWEVPIPEHSWTMGFLNRCVPDWVCALFTCPFCLSHHTPYLLALVCFLPSLFVVSPWAVFLWKLPVYSLAATRLGNLLNALVPPSVRYEFPDE